jgi:hypothetical protein
MKKAFPNPREPASTVGYKYASSFETGAAQLCPRLAVMKLRERLEIQASRDGPPGERVREKTANQSASRL